MYTYVRMCVWVYMYSMCVFNLPKGTFQVLCEQRILLPSRQPLAQLSPRSPGPHPLSRHLRIAFVACEVQGKWSTNKRIKFHCPLGFSSLCSMFTISWQNIMNDGKRNWRKICQYNERLKSIFNSSLNQFNLLFNISYHNFSNIVFKTKPFKSDLIHNLNIKYQLYIFLFSLYHFFVAYHTNLSYSPE